jgi:hypothetical protein
MDAAAYATTFPIFFGLPLHLLSSEEFIKINSSSFEEMPKYFTLSMQNKMEKIFLLFYQRKKIEKNCRKKQSNLNNVFA